MLSASDRWPRLATSDFQILIWLGLTQLRSSASQHHAFCLRQHGTYRPSVCGFSARRTEKPHTIGKEHTALPKAQHANCVSPNNNKYPASPHLRQGCDRVGHV